MDGEVNSERLLGVWRLVSYVIEDLETKERMHLFGERPTGYFQPRVGTGMWRSDQCFHTAVGMS